MCGIAASGAPSAANAPFDSADASPSALTVRTASGLYWCPLAVTLRTQCLCLQCVCVCVSQRVCCWIFATINYDCRYAGARWLRAREGGSCVPFVCLETCFNERVLEKFVALQPAENHPRRTRPFCRQCLASNLAGYFGRPYFFFSRKKYRTPAWGSFVWARGVVFQGKFIILSYLPLQKSTTKTRGVPSLAASCLLARCIYLETFCGSDRHVDRLVQVW